MPEFYTNVKLGTFLLQFCAKISNNKQIHEFISPHLQSYPKNIPDSKQLLDVVEAVKTERKVRSDIVWVERFMNTRKKEREKSLEKEQKQHGYKR